MVHRRELDGEVLVFGNEGALYLNGMTWWDHNTESLWSQPRGEAMVGPLKGERLELFPSTLTTWQEWSQSHPDTLALDSGGRVGTGGFRIDSMMVAVEIGEDIAAFPIPLLRTIGSVNAVVDGIPVVVVMDDEQWNVFNRSVDGRLLTFKGGDGVLIDVASGTQWGIALGFGVSGALADHQLLRVPAFTVFPSEYDNFWPDGEIWVP